MSAIRLFFVVLFLSLGAAGAVLVATYEGEIVLPATVAAVEAIEIVEEQPDVYVAASTMAVPLPQSKVEEATAEPLTQEMPVAAQPIRSTLVVPEIAAPPEFTWSGPTLPRADGGILPHDLPETVPPLPLTTTSTDEPVKLAAATAPVETTLTPAVPHEPMLPPAAAATDQAETATQGNLLRMSLATQLEDAAPLPAGPEKNGAVSAETAGNPMAVEPIGKNRHVEPPMIAPPFEPVASTADAGHQTYPVQRVAQILPAEGDNEITMEFPNSDIREVLELLSKAGDLNILASPSVQGTVNASLKNVDIETALEAILRSSGFVARREKNFVFVGTAKDFEEMNQAADRLSTRVYRPNYVKAAEVQTLITPMLSPQIGTISISSAAEVGIASDSAASGGDDFAGSEVLLVRDYESVLAQIDQVMDEVDQRPLQVSIEAMIISVNLADEETIGVDFEAFRSKSNARVIGNAPVNNLANINIGANSGLKFGFLDSDLATFFEALESVGETHVISSPRLMCLNKQRAEIHIGQEEGYVSTTVTETAATQTVEFLEVGTQLRLRPFISTDGLVRLEVHPELSTGSVEVAEGFTLPSKSVTQVTTNVMVRDGATLVIGGLLREDIQRDTSQIPIIGSMPLMGALFRSKTDKTTRDEIIVLITPRIVHEPQFNCEGEFAECEAMQTHAIFADKLGWTSRLSYARRYRRMAKAAWSAGDHSKALKLVNMSIHFEPLNRESAWIRSQILAEAPYTEESIRRHLRTGVWPKRTSPRGVYADYPVVNPTDGPHTPHGTQSAPPADRGVRGHRHTLETDTPAVESAPVTVSPNIELLAPGQIDANISDLPEPDNDIN